METTAVEATGTPAPLQKPKKAVSAYWIYSNEKREEITKELKEKNSGKVGLGDIAKAIAAKWAELPEADKKPFEEKAAEDKKRHEREMKAYTEESDPAGTLRKKYEHLIPKKPLTAYFMFSQDPVQREKAIATLKEASAEHGNKQVTSKLAEMWKASTSEEQKVYVDKHKEEMETFVQKQKEWQATPEFKEIEEAEKKMAEQKKAENNGEETADSKGSKRAKANGDANSPDAKKAKKAEAKEPKEKAPPKEKPAKKVIASGKSHREMFEALRNSGGLVNAAKRTLIGAGGA